MAQDNNDRDMMVVEEEDLLAYLEDNLIPCAGCDQEIHVDESYRWVNRLVCRECIAEYEGLGEDDEANYDDIADNEWE